MAISQNGTLFSLRGCSQVLRLDHMSRRVCSIFRGPREGELDASAIDHAGWAGPPSPSEARRVVFGHWIILDYGAAL